MCPTIPCRFWLLGTSFMFLLFGSFLANESAKQWHERLVWGIPASVSGAAGAQVSTPWGPLCNMAFFPLIHRDHSISFTKSTGYP